MTVVAVLGTGLMGAPMAANLARAGYDVRLWNRDPAKAQAIGHGATVLASPQEAVAEADAVICMLSSGPVCKAVLFGDSEKPGAAQAMSKGALLVVMSSISHPEALEMSKMTQASGLSWIDAPVSGGTLAARDGNLSIMAGGADDVVEAATPLLSAMGTVTHIGPAGAGALCKLANQMLVASTIAAVSECLLMARSGGADPARVRTALLGGFAGSRIMQEHGARMIADDFAPGGPAKYQVKDTKAALEVARDLGLTLPVLSVVDSLFESLVAHGGADLDHSALILELERRNATPLPDRVRLSTTH